MTRDDINKSSLETVEIDVPDGVAMNAMAHPGSVAYGQIHPYAVREKEAARYIGLTGSTLRKWRMNGGGPRFCRLGGSVVYRMRDLRVFVDSMLEKAK